MRKTIIVVFALALGLACFGVGYLAFSVSKEEATQIARLEFKSREGWDSPKIQCDRRLDGGWSATARWEANVWYVGKPYHGGYVIKRRVLIDRRGNVTNYGEAD